MAYLINLVQLAGLVVGLGLISSTLLGQDTPDETVRAIRDLKQQLEKDEAVSAAVKTEITAQIQMAEFHLAKVEDFKKRIETDRAAAASAGTRSSAYLAEFETVKDAPAKQVAEEMTLEQVESEVSSQKKLVDQLKFELSQNDQEASRRTSRRQLIRTQADANAKLLTDVAVELKSLPANDLSLATQAKRVLLMSSRALYEAEKLSLSVEQARFDAGDKENLLRNQRDLLTLKLSQSQARLAALEDLQTKQRKIKADESVQSAAKELEEVKRQNPLLAKSYEINAGLAKRVQEVEAEAKNGKENLDKITARLLKLQTQARETRKRVTTIGLTGSVGAMLRKQKSELPNTRLSYSDANAVKERMDKIQYEKFDADQERSELSPEVIIEEIKSDPELMRREVAKRFGPDFDQRYEQNEAKLIAELQENSVDELISARRQHLDALSKSLDRLFEEVLTDTEFNDRKLAQQSLEFREYINERILWIRSNNVLFSQWELDQIEATSLSPTKWGGLVRAVSDAIVASPFWFGISTVLLTIMFLLKPGFRREIDRMGVVAARGSCDSFWPTARACVLTLLVAVVTPAFFFALGLGLQQDSRPPGDLFSALGPALIAVAWFILPLEILRRICRPQGLANEHFDWSDQSVLKLRNQLLMLLIPGAILVFCVAVLRNLDPIHRVDLVERCLFVAGMILIAFFFYRTFHPERGIFDVYLKANQNSWANQTSAVWFGLILGVPLALAGLAVWGYYYTALNLVQCAFATFVFAVIVETLRQLLKRLILVQRRHVHIQTARRKHAAALQSRREQQQAQAAARKAQGVAVEEVPEPTTAVPLTDSIVELENELDVDDNAKQANKLVSLLMVVVWAVGLWLIWTDVLPALKALDSYVIYPNSIVDNVDPQAEESGVGTSNAASPMVAAATTASTEETAATSVVDVKPEPSPRITVRNLLVFLVISIITLVSTRNFPSALEMLLLEQLPVDRSFRYAIKSLISYAIVMVGLILAFRSLSITWSSVQWLATALTFGLAFGLQEIFANFVAGIILMFERPIRIGDWITVDEFTGVVTKIRTRATTIVNWDRKEYVIPNKDFITGRLINWTLSDAINRIVINVGIAYGSDVEKAKAILYDVCAQHPEILEDPPTQIIFDGFGDSSLNIVCRTFLGEIDCRPQVIDQLHTQINQRFIESGIEISFPQRDLHIRSASPELGEMLGQVRPHRSSDDSSRDSSLDSIGQAEKLDPDSIRHK